MTLEYEEALCREYHGDLWFPPAFSEERTGRESEYYDIAKMVCSVCMHQTECRQMAEDNNEEWGCWGGTSPSDRRRGHTTPSKRLANTDFFKVLPRPDTGTRVQIPELQKAVRSVTKRRKPQPTS